MLAFVGDSVLRSASHLRSFRSTLALGGPRFILFRVGAAVLDWNTRCEDLGRGLLYG